MKGQIQNYNPYNIAKINNINWFNKLFTITALFFVLNVNISNAQTNTSYNNNSLEMKYDHLDIFLDEVFVINNWKIVEHLLNNNLTNTRVDAIFVTNNWKHIHTYKYLDDNLLLLNDRYTNYVLELEQLIRKINVQYIKILEYEEKIKLMGGLHPNKQEEIATLKKEKKDAEVHFSNIIQNDGKKLMNSIKDIWSETHKLLPIINKLYNEEKRVISYGMSNEQKNILQENLDKTLKLRNEISSLHTKTISACFSTIDIIWIEYKNWFLYKK